MPKVKRYFTSSHTAHGFVNFLASNVTGFTVYLVNHPSLTLKTKVFQGLINYVTENNEHVDVLLSAHSQDFYDGIIVPERSLAFIADHIMVEKIEVEENFSLGDLSKHSMLTEQKIEIDDLFKQAYQSIGASLQAHKQIEKYYVKTMNFTRSNELIEQVKEQLFIESGQSKFDQPRVNRRLFGSNTIHGNYNVVAELLPLVERRFYLQGGPGTGKSVFMKEIIKACLDNRYNVEQYMCSFDPSSTDMVIIPELSICLLDSTGAHEFSPLAKDDVVIDLFKEAGTGNVGHKYERQITSIKNKQSESRNHGYHFMQKAGKHLLQLERDLMSDVNDKLIHDTVSKMKRILA